MKFFKLSWWMTPIISFNWVRARDLGVQSRYKASLSKLAWIKRLRGKGIRPLGQWTAEYYITQGQGYYGLGENDRAIESFKKANRELNQEHDYTPMEKDYLLAYIVSSHENLDLGIENQIDMNQIDLDYIPSDLLIYYPLKVHPDWIH